MSGDVQCLWVGGHESHSAQPDTGFQPRPRMQRGGSGLESCGMDSGSKEQPLPGHSMMGNKPILALQSLAVP